MVDYAKDDANNPLFSAPMQLCRPSPCHSYLEPNYETLEVLHKVNRYMV